MIRKADVFVFDKRQYEDPMKMEARMAREAVAHEKGLEMMSRSGIKKNNRRRDENQPLLREHATFRDLKFEKHDQRKKKNFNHNRTQNR